METSIQNKTDKNSLTLEFSQKDLESKAKSETASTRLYHLSALIVETTSVLLQYDTKIYMISM